jgi:hypothetical protein
MGESPMQRNKVQKKKFIGIFGQDFKHPGNPGENDIGILTSSIQSEPPPWSSGQSSRGPGFDSRRFQIF